MFFTDRLTLDKPRRTADGYVGVHARAARSGVYQYLGRELDPEGKKFAADQIVNVYRPPEEVFDKASLGSFVCKPITDDHPADAVDATNWRKLARGTIMGAAKDGEYVGFDLAFLDADAIKAVDEGKRELSAGYSLDLMIEDGTAPDGTVYQAVQRNIRGNHVAIVAKGRAGSSCRIGDAAPCEPMPSDEVAKMLADQRTYEPNGNGGINEADRSDANRSHDGGAALKSGEVLMATKTILVDGLQVEVTDAAEAAITKLQGQVKDAVSAKDTAEAKVVEHAATITSKDEQIADLEAKLADAAITPAKLRDAAKQFADVCAKAKALGVAHDEEADIDAVMKAVVDAKMGDAAKDFTPEHIAIAFQALTKDAKPADKLKDGIRDTVNKTTTDSEAEAAYTEMVSGLQDAWKPKAA
jgi:hypothetical protein